MQCLTQFPPYHIETKKTACLASRPKRGFVILASGPLPKCRFYFLTQSPILKVKSEEG